MNLLSNTINGCSFIVGVGIGVSVAIGISVGAGVGVGIGVDVVIFAITTFVILNQVPLP